MLLGFVVFKLGILATLSFLFAWAWTPFLSHLLAKYKLSKHIRDEQFAPVYSKLHKAKEHTPTMGGALIWGTTLVIALLFYYLSVIYPIDFFKNLNFLTRSQVWLPLGVLILAAIVGAVDDIFNSRMIGPKGGGLQMRHRLAIYTAIAGIGAWWFFFKLNWDTLHVPFLGDYTIGLWYIPFFMFVIIATAFSVNEIDGLDGLAGGTLFSAFGAFAAIAIMQGKYDLAAFCVVIIGALLAFLWLNIYPAKFFMGDTGSMSLGITLGVVAMLTNAALLLPIIGFLFMLESISVIVQMMSKKLCGIKIFLSTPIHHHFEAKGWLEPTIVMRFWIISWVTSLIGILIALADRGFY